MPSINEYKNPIIDEIKKEYDKLNERLDLFFVKEQIQEPYDKHVVDFDKNEVITRFILHEIAAIKIYLNLVLKHNKL